jgi:tRNA-splicing endonuclease subunit Sen34
VLVGGLPGYRQQDAVHGLPLQLSPEEVTLCLARGWAELYSLDADAALSAAAAVPAPPPPAPAPKKPLPAKGWGARSALPHNAKRQKRDALSGTEPWTAVLRTPSARVDTPCVSERDGEISASDWSFPRLDSERRRCAVFAHMHARGATLTSGAKFGAEYLAYPGDPAAYHASFTVRVMDGDGEAVKEKNDDDDDARAVSLLSLVAATRMSHGARKHCVLAGARRVGHVPSKLEEVEADGVPVGEARRRASRALREWEVSCVTVTPDVEQSSQRRRRVGA